MKQYQYILLDWDGNLAKTLDIWLNAFREVVTQQGLNPSDQEIAACFGASKDRFTELGLTDVDASLKLADSIAKKELPDVQLYPGALILLEYLRRHNKKLALLTTSPHENIAHLLEKYDIIKLFDAIVAADNVTHHKPHPEPIEKALELLGGNKDQAVIIGDSDKDLGAAHNAGIDSVLFYPEEHKKFYDLNILKSLKPTYIVSAFSEVETLIK